MISVIVSSTTHTRASFNFLVDQTCGVPCELIWVENPNSFSLTQAYNFGARKATFPYLVFVHDDVQFLSEHWGNEVINILSTHSNGLVGIAGSRYFGKYQAGWWGFPCGQNHRYRIKQGKGADAEWMECRPAEEKHSEVAVLDGVFLATRKDIWEEFPWDESLPGFHGYDLDFSLQINQKYSVLVTYAIDIYHESKGNLSTSWVKGLEFVWEKWKNNLPVHTQPIAKETLERWDKKNATFLIYAFIQHEISRIKIATVAFQCFFGKKITFKTFWTALNYVFFGRKNDFLLQKWQQNLYEA